jgi:uncharacterized membrane protein YfcA
LNLPTAIFLFFASALGGGMNAVAGGGSFIAFPALLFAGVPAISANATNTLSLWVGTTASGGAYPQKLNIPRRILIPLGIMSLLGGLGGAILLIHTPARTFLRVIPWLLLGATLLFAFGKCLTGRISPSITRDAGNAAVIGASLFELLVALYGGYFGGGIGIMNLAMLSALGMTDIHAMNKLKVMLGGVINGVATITFITTKAIYWPHAMVMIFGSVLGGYSTAHYAQKLPQSWVRAFVILVGTSMTIYFLWRGYR